MLGDGAYINADLVVPHRKRPGRPLLAGEEADNKKHRRVRARVEHAISRLKNYKILRDCRHRARGRQEFERLAPEGGGQVGVLGKEPCLIGSLFTDQLDARPAVFDDDPLEPGRVVGVDPVHHRVAGQSPVRVPAIVAPSCRQRTQPTHSRATSSYPCPENRRIGSPPYVARRHGALLFFQLTALARGQCQGVLRGWKSGEGTRRGVPSERHWNIGKHQETRSGPGHSPIRRSHRSSCPCRRDLLQVRVVGHHLQVSPPR